jgi:hypothetical protein
MDWVSEVSTSDPTPFIRKPSYQGQVRPGPFSYSLNGKRGQSEISLGCQISI